MHSSQTLKTGYGSDPWQPTQTKRKTVANAFLFLFFQRHQLLIVGALALTKFQ